MKALILAAGYATRLYPLTKEYPKPLLKIKQKSIISYILDKLENLNSLDEIVVITNHKFISQFRRWAKGIKIKKRIILVDNLTKNHSDRRGAIGDIDFAIDSKHIADDLLVIGGDNLFNSDLRDFLSFAKTNRPHPVIAAYNIRNLREAKKYGVIKLNRKKQVIDFQEKPSRPKSSLVAMCLYYFPKESLGLVKEYLNPVRNTKSKHDATGFYIDWLRKRSSVYGFVFTGHWADVGDHQTFNKLSNSF